MPFQKGHKGFRTKESYAKSNKNKHFSPKTEFKKEQTPWNKGTKGIMKAWNKGTKGVCKSNSGSFKKGSIPWSKGRRRTKKTIKKILQGQRKRWLSGEPTSIEKKVYEELKTRGLLFEKQKIIGGKFTVDAYIPKLNLIVECDGDYWHSLPVNVRRDKSKDKYLGVCGYNLLRLTETEINNNDFKLKLDREIN